MKLKIHSVVDLISVYIGECGSVTTKRIDELFETKELFIESIS